MARLTVTFSISNVDPGTFKVGGFLKDETGAVIGTSEDTPVIVPVSPDLPVFTPPEVVVEP